MPRERDSIRDHSGPIELGPLLYSRQNHPITEGVLFPSLTIVFLQGFWPEIVIHVILVEKDLSYEIRNILFEIVQLATEISKALHDRARHSLDLIEHLLQTGLQVVDQVSCDRTRIFENLVLAENRRGIDDEVGVSGENFRKTAGSGGIARVFALRDRHTRSNRG